MTSDQCSRSQSLRKLGRSFGSIRARLAVLVLLTLTLLAGYTFWAYVANAHGLLRFEEMQKREQMASALQALKISQTHLVRNLKDYAYWDEMVAAAESRDQAWLDKNITQWVPSNFQIDLVLLTDTRGRTIYRYGNASEATGDALRFAWVRDALAGKTTAGIIEGSRGLMLLASTPVLTADEQGPPRGAYVYGRWLSVGVLRNLKRAARADLAVYHNDRLVGATTTGLPTIAGRVGEMRRTLERGPATITERPSSAAISVFHLLTGMDGKPVGVLQLTGGRAAVLRLERRLWWLCAMMLVVAVALAGTVYGYLWHRLGAPLRRLTEMLQTDALTRWSGRLATADKRDEIGQLTEALTQVAMSFDAERQKLVCASTRDSLTGLFNHRQLQERLAEEVQRARRYSRQMAVLMLDIDHFKYVNDSLGHQGGDQVLMGIAHDLVTALRSADLVYRYGGEEFAVILPETDRAGALVVAERMRESVAQHEIVVASAKDEDGDERPVRRVHVTVSIGVSQFPEDGGTPDQLIAAADAALMHAKRESRNAVRSYGGAVLPPASVVEDASPAADLSTVARVATVLDERDPFTRGHSQEVTRYALTIGRRLGLAQLDLQQLRAAGLAHDIGKIGVARVILTKETALTEEERRQMHNHPIIGAAILSHVPQMQGAIPAVLHHHERYDGGGYPQGLMGEEIPLLSRIIAVAEAFQAMCVGRAGRPACARDEALKELQEFAGQRYDPECVAALTQALEDESPALDDPASLVAAT